MNKSYSRIEWENYPSMKTAVNADNLNRVDVGLDEVDNRVITLDTTKATKVEVSTLIKEVEYNEHTGIITFTRKNGSKFTIDTPMEKIQTGIYYDPVTEMLTLPLIDGTTIGVDLSRLITEYEFQDSETIAFSVSADGKVTAIVKEGSIQEKHLQPNYLADIKVEVAKAEAAATSADASKTEAAGSASTATEKAGEAAVSAADAENSATAADASKTAAAESASIATDKANSASGFADNAEASKDAAATYANNAANSANIATEKASDAEVSADSAATSATSADTYAKKSQSYAVGTGGEVRENDDTDCALYYYEQTKRISQGFNGIIPMGTISFVDLDNPDNQKPGYFFDISDSFVSDERFKNGSGIFYGAGSNVLYTADGMWDVTAASMVSGVKGDAETEYRQGFVNITPENVGALPANGNSVSASKWKTARNINGMSIDGTANRFNYGVCSTAAGTAQKIVSCAGFSLGTGAEISVKFTVTNTAASPTLNVNSTGAKPVYYRGSAITAGYLAANRTYSFRYNGTQWDLVGDIDTNTTYKNMTGATASAAGKAGLVPPPGAGDQGKFLRGDATWQEVAEIVEVMTGATANSAGASGLAPAPAKGAQNSYLTGGATYQNVDDHAAAFTSSDVADGSATAWTSVAKLASGETHKSIFGKLSTMFKNVRYLYKMLGTTDIFSIGDGTVTGALSSLNTGINEYTSVVYKSILVFNKMGRVVCMQEEGYIILSFNEVIVPEGFRPHVSVWFLAYDGNTKKQVLCVIEESGKIKFYTEYPNQLSECRMLASACWMS